MTKKFNSVQFSCDAYRLTRAFLADPAVKLQVLQAISDGPAEVMTEQLGYGNLAEEGEKEEWHTLFPATYKDKKAGEDGLFVRAKKTGYPLLRLRKQTPKTQQVTADAPAGPQVDAAAIDAVLASLGISKEQFVELTRAAYKPEEQVPEDEAPTNPGATFELPADIQALIAKK